MGFAREVGGVIEESSRERPHFNLSALVSARALTANHVISVLVTNVVCPFLFPSSPVSHFPPAPLLYLLPTCPSICPTTTSTRS